MLAEAVRRISGDPQSAKTLQQAIGALERAGLFTVVPDQAPRRFKFRHVLMRTAAYESLPARTRRAWHAVIADVMEAGLAEEPVTVSAEAVAKHRSAADQPDRAAAAFSLAGRAAARRFANPEAIALFSAAIEEAKKVTDEAAAVWAQLDARLGLNASVIARFGWAAQELEANGTELLAVAERSGAAEHVFEARRMLFNVALLRADRPAAELHLAGMRQVLNAAEVADGEMVFERCAGGKLMFLDGDIPRADAALGRSLAAFDPGRHRVGQGLYDLDGEICVRSLRAWLLWFAGDPAGSIRAGREVIALARRVDHPFSLAYALCLGGSALLSAGEIDEVFSIAAEVEGLAARYHMAYWSAYAKILRGGAVLATDAEAAIAILRTARQLYVDTGARMLLPWVVGQEAQALAKTGRGAQARELLRAARLPKVGLFRPLADRTAA
jgi:hypothetical protein